MTPARVLHIITEIGKGLDHAHRAGLLHRDIKPANFLLTDSTHGEERVLLADFGIAKPSEDATQLTKTGTFLATVAYASPEQLSGHPLTSRSDIYSLACSFYRLLTNQNPYPGTQPLTVMMGHINEPPPRITKLRPDLPPSLDDVLARALAKDPAARFATCTEFTDAAARAMAVHGTRSAVPEPDSASIAQFTQSEFPRTAETLRNLQPAASGQTEGPTFRPPQRHVGLKVVGALFLVLAVIGITVWFVESGGKAAQSDLADPCALMAADQTRFVLSGESALPDKLDERGCKWKSGLAPGFAVTLSLLAQGIPPGPVSQSVAIGTGNGLETITPAGEGRNYPTCSIAWVTRSGSASLSLDGNLPTTDTDDLCTHAVDIAASLYPKSWG